MSGPAEKVAKIVSPAACDSYSNSGDLISMHRRHEYKLESACKFFVIVCHDVFLEVLCFGNRCQLIKLERVGRRFYRPVNSMFNEMPFLRLHLHLEPRLNKGEGLDACLYNNFPGSGNKKKVSKADLAVLPQFIRFGHVFLAHVINSKWASGDLSSQRVMEKCEQFQQHLQLVKKALDHSTTIQFDFCINRFEPSCFLGPPQLLNYIRAQLLPNCDSVNGYLFKIDIAPDPINTCAFHSWDELSDSSTGSEESSGGEFLDTSGIATEIISSVLQMPPINQCLNVGFLFTGMRQQTSLPENVISTWLQRKSDGRTHKERTLYINLDERIHNGQEMCIRFKETFESAEFPVLPFTFTFLRCDWITTTKDEIYSNNKTNEELSICKDKSNQSIKIKRTSKRGSEKKQDLDSKKPS